MFTIPKFQIILKKNNIPYKIVKLFNTYLFHYLFNNNKFLII